MFYHLDHVQYMISDRSPIMHTRIENGTRHSVPFNVVWRPERFLQHLKNLFRLCLLKFSTELVIHRSQHYAPYYGAIIGPLQISVPDCATHIRSWLLRCRIRYHIKDPFMLQDYPKSSIPTIEIWTCQLITVQQ